jgi:hypothetical protein
MVMFFVLLLLLLSSCEYDNDQYLDLSKYQNLDQLKKKYQESLKEIPSLNRESATFNESASSEVRPYIETMLPETQIYASLYETIRSWNLLKKTHKALSPYQKIFLRYGIESYVARPLEKFHGDKLIIGTGWNPKYFCETPFYLEWSKNQGRKILIDLNQPTDQGRRISETDFNQCLKDIKKIKNTYYSVDVNAEMEPDFLASAVNPIHMSYFPAQRFSYILFDYFPVTEISSPLIWENTYRILKSNGKIKIITGKGFPGLLRATLMQSPWVNQIKNHSNLSAMELIKN